MAGDGGGGGWGVLGSAIAVFFVVAVVYEMIAKTLDYLAAHIAVILTVGIAVGVVTIGAVWALLAGLHRHTVKQLALPAPAPKRAIPRLPDPIGPYGKVAAAERPFGVDPGKFEAEPAPAPDEPVPGEPCEGPSCDRPLPKRPWTCGTVSELTEPGKAATPHEFCSQFCMNEWIAADQARHAAEAETAGRRR